MASISAVAGDFDGALRGALASLERLRAQDEPFWAAVAASNAGVEEMAEGRYDDALGHLTEVRDLGERVDNARLIAWSRVQLGTLALVQGRLDDARALLDEGLDLSLATYSTRNVTLYLAAFAQLALVEGDAERAALLAGAADGLRRRAGLGVWPLLRRGGGRAGDPGPRSAGGGPVRGGVRHRRPAHPAGGGGRRPGPARRRHDGPLSRGRGHGTPVVPPPHANACSCPLPGDPRDRLAAADGAFIGKLVGRRETGPLGSIISTGRDVIYTFEVAEAVKGDIGQRVDLRSAASGMSCGFEVPADQAIGILLDRRSGMWRSGLCGQIEPGKLRAAAAPSPAPDGRGPTAFIVGGSFGRHA
jgi:hypothetical protein